MSDNRLEYINEGYQAADARIVDYSLTPLEGTRLMIRGSVDASKPFGVAVGAAQTFGRFVRNPFPEIVARNIGLPILNLGFSGAGASFFLRRPGLLSWINRAEFVVVQAMSGRSLSNFALEACENQGLVRKRGTNEKVFAEYAYRDILLGGDRSLAIALRAANSAQWLREMAELFDRISVGRKCLLWFSRRKPDYNDGLGDLGAYWADLPHFVNREVLNELLSNCGVACVEAVSTEGLPQPLVDMASNEPVEMWDQKNFPDVRLRCHNHYYPSPEMHERCAGAVADWLRVERSATKPLHKRNERRRVVIHHHIFKNAGSSVDAALSDVLGNKWQSYDPPADDKILKSTDLEYFLESNPELLAISTHQGRAPYDLEGSFDTLELSLVRNPIGRALSIWKYERWPARQASISSEITRQAGLLSFEEFILWCVARRTPVAPFSNYQVRMLSGLGCDPDAKWYYSKVTYGDLNRANEYIARIGCVGVVERFARSIERFNQRLETFLPGIELRNYRANSNEDSRESGEEEARHLLSKGTYELLLSANALDFALYNQVVYVGGY